MSKKMNEANKIIASGKFVIPSPAEVMAASRNGAWTAKVLARWGVKWPPQKGWKDELRRKWERAQTGPSQLEAMSEMSRATTEAARVYRTTTPDPTVTNVMSGWNGKSTFS